MDVYMTVIIASSATGAMLGFLHQVKKRLDKDIQAMQALEELVE